MNLPKTLEDFLHFQGVAARPRNGRLIMKGVTDDPEGFHSDPSFYRNELRAERTSSWWSGRAYRFFLERQP